MLSGRSTFENFAGPRECRFSTGQNCTANKAGPSGLVIEDMGSDPELRRFPWKYVLTRQQGYPWFRRGQKSGFFPHQHRFPLPTGYRLIRHKHHPLPGFAYRLTHFHAWKSNRIAAQVYHSCSHKSSPPVGLCMPGDPYWHTGIKAADLCEFGPLVHS